MRREPTPTELFPFFRNFLKSDVPNENFSTQMGKRYTVYASKEVVISGGAINSPQLLLLSGIGPKKHLEAVRVPLVKDLPGVGQNLHNHVAFALPWTIDEDDVYDLDWDSLSQYFGHRKGPMASTGLSQFTGIWSSSHASAKHPDLQFFFGGYWATCAETGEVGALSSNGKRQISISAVNLHPRSRGDFSNDF